MENKYPEKKLKLKFFSSFYQKENNYMTKFKYKT